MNRTALAALLLPLAACDDLVDKYEGLTNPLVTQGILLGIEAPESDQVDLSGTEYEEGTGVVVFLADAESADDIESAPVEGADVSVRGQQIGDVPANDAGGGAYEIAPGPLVYADGAIWTVTVGIGDEVSRAAVELPPPANVTVPEQHTKGAPITVNFAGKGFTSVLGVVIDVETGEIVWDNRPEDIRDVYELTRGTEEVGVFEVPGTAFPGESVYALGLAGMVHTEAADLESMNTALSSILAGKMKIYPVVTAQVPQQ